MASIGGDFQVADFQGDFLCDDGCLCGIPALLAVAGIGLFIIVTRGKLRQLTRMSFALGKELPPPGVTPGFAARS